MIRTAEDEEEEVQDYLGYLNKFLKMKVEAEREKTRGEDKQKYGSQIFPEKAAPDAGLLNGDTERDIQHRFGKSMNIKEIE